MLSLAKSGGRPVWQSTKTWQQQHLKKAIKPDFEDQTASKRAVAQLKPSKQAKAMHTAIRRPAVLQAALATGTGT